MGEDGFLVFLCNCNPHISEQPQYVLCLDVHVRIMCTWLKTTAYPRFLSDGHWFLRESLWLETTEHFYSPCICIRLLSATHLICIFACSSRISHTCFVLSSAPDLNTFLRLLAFFFCFTAYFYPASFLECWLKAQ